MSTAEYHQKAFYCFVCLFVCQCLVKLHLIFPFGIWAIQAMALGYPSSDEYGFILVEWGLSHIISWLTTPIRFVPSLPQQHISHEGQILAQRFLCMGCCPYFSFATFPHLRDQHIRVIVSYRYQLDFSMFNKLGGCCLQQWDSLSMFREKVLCLNIWNVGDSHRTSFANLSLNAPHTHHWKLQFIELDR